MQKPIRREFFVATSGGGRAVRVGYVVGDWATTKEKYFWEFTHLPTGARINVYPVHETKASALAHLNKLASGEIVLPEWQKEILSRGWGLGL